MIHRIHTHPIMERQCQVPSNHVIIDSELFWELVRRFGDNLPLDNKVEKQFQDGGGDQK